MDAPTDPQSAPLAYARLPARWGVSVDREPASLRINLPPIRRLRYLPIGYMIGLPCLFGFNMLLIVAVVLDRSATPIGAFCFYFAVLCAVAAFAARRLFASTAIVLDDQTLSISWLFGKRFSSTRSWPRGRIATVKRNISSGQLVIYVVGRDLVDVNISPDPKLVDWVTGEISQALQTIPARPAQAGEALPSPFREEFPRPMRKGPARSILIAIACAFTLVGLVFLVMGQPWRDLALIPMLLAALPAGLAMGMQDKDGNYLV